MLIRRDLLRSSRVAALAAAVLLVITSVGCTGDDDSFAVATNPTTPACDGVSATSTVVQGHVHTICVPLADLTNPPVSGVAVATSVEQDHFHTVDLTQQQLSQLAAGAVVSTTTTIANSHAHIFTLQRVPVTATMPKPIYNLGSAGRVAAR